MRQQVQQRQVQRQRQATHHRLLLLNVGQATRCLSIRHLTAMLCPLATQALGSSQRSQLIAHLSQQCAVAADEPSQAAAADDDEQSQADAADAAAAVAGGWML